MLRLRLRRGQSGADFIGVHAVDLLHMPTDGTESGWNVLRERQPDRAGQRDLILVVEVDQLAQAEMPGERGSLGRYPLHQVAVRDDAVDVVVDDIVCGLLVEKKKEALG